MIWTIKLHTLPLDVTSSPSDRLVPMTMYDLNPDKVSSDLSLMVFMLTTCSHSSHSILQKKNMKEFESTEIDKTCLMVYSSMICEKRQRKYIFSTYFVFGTTSHDVGLYSCKVNRGMVGYMNLSSTESKITYPQE